MRLKSGLHASNRKGSWISKKIKSKQKDKKERQLLKLLPLDEGEESHILVFSFYPGNKSMRLEKSNSFYSYFAEEKYVM